MKEGLLCPEAPVKETEEQQLKNLSEVERKRERGREVALLPAVSKCLLVEGGWATPDFSMLVGCKAVWPQQGRKNTSPDHRL